MGFIVPVIKAIATVVAKSVVAKAVVKLAAAAIISKVATKAISKLIAKRTDVGSSSGLDAGARVQLPPAAENKLPIVYGTSWVGGPIIDAKISVDQKFMWYVIALSEKPDGQTVTFDTTDGVYYGGKKVQFGSNGVVNALITNTTPGQIDTKVAGKIYIWLFQDDANSTTGSNSTQTPYQIMTDATTGGGISDGWNSSTYTSDGQSVQLNNMVYAIVRVEYNVDATTTSLDTLQVKISNNMGGDNGCKPGVAILDYLTNERYGCAIPLSLVDTTSLTTLDAYSDQYITYTPVGGGFGQQRRYRVNGPLDTGNDCLTNLQLLVDTCDSWLQYTETSGKWRVIPNGPYSGTLANLFNVNANNTKSCNVIGGIQINPIDLNDTYNSVEVAYPNTNVKDQTDYQIVDLTDPSTAWYPLYNGVLSPNEANNRLNFALPLVNNAVQAKYLAVRRLLQSREDLIITCQTDYSGIQIDAGDIIRVNHDVYGWTDKLFRVSSVSEVQDEQGNLSALVEAFEYNGTIYNDNAIQDFVPADNTGLKDPNVISPPCRPIITEFTDSEALVSGFNVSSCVPDQGVVIYMDFNYGNTSNVQQHVLYRTVQNAGGLPFINSDSANGYYNNVTITVNDLAANLYFWSVTARNDFAGRTSDGSDPFNWGGANINPYDPNTGNGGLPPNVYRPNTIPANAIIGSAFSIAVQDFGINVVSNATVLNFINDNFLISQNGNRANIDLNLPENIGGNNFSINFGNPQGNLAGPLLPVYANANVTRNVPIIVPEAANFDSTVGTYSYYQGTSSLVAAGDNGNRFYAANSTGAWTPTNASILLINDGDDNWYRVLEDTFTQGIASGYSTIYNNSGLAFVIDENANVATQVQIVQGIKYGNLNYYNCDTNAMDTIILAVPGVQYTWERLQTQITSNNGFASAVGIATFIRNIGTPDIIVTKGTIQTSLSGAIYF
jgi:hypothetical protein